MTTREKLEHGWSRGYGTPLPGVLDACEGYWRNREAVDRGDYVLTDAARARELARCRDVFEADYEKARDAAVAAVTMEVDAELDAVKDAHDTELRNTATTTRELRAARLAQEMREAPDAAAITRVMDEALLGDDPLVARAAWSAGKRRHAEFRARERQLPPAQADKVRDAAHAFEFAAGVWERKNPPAAKRLRDLEARRQAAVGEVDRQAQFVRQMYGIK